VITLDGLSKTYPNGTHALRRVHLHAARGQVVTLLGRSGAGKSTLLRCVNGLTTPSAGEVVVGGLRLDGRGRSLRQVRRMTGMIFQQFNLVGRLSVLENVLTGRLGHRPGWPALFRRFPPEDYRLAEACLARVGLGDRAGQRADTLSGGERQRVAVARALAQEPQVLLADEPVASLDPGTAGVVLDLLRRVCREDGLTALVSLHQVGFARALSDRIVGLADGAVAFEGPPEALDGPVLARIYGTVVSDDDELAAARPLLAHA
jgi:phosphonate transport system ATP-binding protein